MALRNTLNSFCGNCNISWDSFNNSNYTNCPSEECTIFRADILYSNDKGTITSNTLIHHLQTWILSQDTPTLMVAGKALSLDKYCPTSVNSATKKACLKLIDEIEIHITAEENERVTNILSPINGGAFAIGVLIGIVATIAIVTLVRICW